MFQISHVEFILLALIHEQPQSTGYQLNSLIRERGYREWTDIGTTSIYGGLKKLKEKEYVTAATDQDKTGRGPKGTNFIITTEGRAVLKGETLQGLSGGRERGGTFMLALSAMSILSSAESLDALRRRTVFLRQEHERVRQICDGQRDCIPLHAALLFRYSLTGILHEILRTEEIIAWIQKSTNAQETLCQSKGQG